MIASGIIFCKSNTFDIRVGFSHSPRMASHRRAHVGRYFSDGARQMWRMIEAGVLCLEDVGRAGSWSRGLPHHWLYGDRRPSLHSALALEKLYGIPVEAWTAAPSEPFALPQRAIEGGDR